MPTLTKEEEAEWKRKLPEHIASLRKISEGSRLLTASFSRIRRAAINLRHAIRNVTIERD